MKTLLFSFLGIVLGFIVIILIIYCLIRNILYKAGFGNRGLIDLYNESKRQAMLDKSRQKDVSGMTNVLMPTIKKYFPEFNVSEFYLLTETSIRKILNAIEKKQEGLLDDNALSLVKDRLTLQIRNMNENDITYVYRDIVFHKHAIKDFKHDDGKAILKISSSLEYYYEEYNGDQVVKKDEYKKQTRYQTEFVFIYDVQKAGYDIKTIGLNCPNCGSPLKGYAQRICNYCKTGIDISVLDFDKAWKIVDFKEEY